MKIAFVYGGQGSQVEGMGHDLYLEYPFVKDFYDAIEANFLLKEVSFNGSLKELSKTEYTQPTMLAFQIAVTKILKFYGILPDVVLGLSLGEYSALYAAEVLGSKELLNLIQYRAKEMSRAARRLNSKMLAVFDDDIEYIYRLCEQNSTLDSFVQVSNINTKGQIVIAGDANLVTKVYRKLNEQGYRARELNTSGPFHTSYMDSVSKRLSKYFESIEFNDPKVPILYNLYGDFKEEGDIGDIMSKQVNNPVLFKDCLERLVDLGPDLILEIGHQNVIKGLIKRIDRRANVLSVNTVASIDKVLKEVEHSGK